MTEPSKYLVALTAALGLFMAVLDNTIVNVALTPISTALNTTLSSIEWVITGYFLAQAAVIPAAGYFSNRVGIKRLFIICLILFTTGSALCGLSHNITTLIVFRIIQGIGGGALFPLAQSLAYQAFSPKERASASAIVGIPVLLAPAFGPTIGGLLTDKLGWEYIFFINVPICFVAVILGILVFPSDKRSENNQQRGNFDIIGLALSILGVLAVVYAFTLVSQAQPGTETALNPRGVSYGWGYWVVWVMLGVGVVLLTAFALYELYVAKDPVLDLRLFKTYNFTIASAVTWFNSMVIFGSFFLLPVFFESVRSPNLSALDAGLALMPQGLAAAVAVGLSGTLLYNRVGPRPLVVIGIALLAISTYQFSHLTPTSDGLSLLPWFIIRGFGFGWTITPVQTLALQTITGKALPKASSLFNVSRQIFSSIGTATLTTLFIQQAASHATDLQTQFLQTHSPKSPAFRAALHTFSTTIVSQAGTAAMNDIFLLVSLGTIGILIVALFLPGKKAALGERPVPGTVAEPKEPIIVGE